LLGVLLERVQMLFVEISFFSSVLQQSIIAITKFE